MYDRAETDNISCYNIGSAEPDILCRLLTTRVKCTYFPDFCATALIINVQVVYFLLIFIEDDLSISFNAIISLQASFHRRRFRSSKSWFVRWFFILMCFGFSSTPPRSTTAVQHVAELAPSKLSSCWDICPLLSVTGPRRILVLRSPHER